MINKDKFYRRQRIFDILFASIISGLFSVIPWTIYVKFSDDCLTRSDKQLFFILNGMIAGCMIIGGMIANKILKTMDLCADNNKYQK